MVYQVGNPAMFEGNRFLPETGTPIWKMLRNKTVLADCEPEPFTVATCMLKSLILRPGCGVSAAFSCTPSSTVVAMNCPCATLRPQSPSYSDWFEVTLNYKTASGSPAHAYPSINNYPLPDKLLA